MSRRSEKQRLLNEEFDDYKINFSRVLKKNSKNLSKLRDAERRRKNKNYAKRRRGNFIFRRG
jgi:hypothetical protein